MVRHNGLAVDWLGYATVRIEGNDAIIYTDPGRYGVLDGEWRTRYGEADHPHGEAYDARDGDLVVVTHNHHYDDDGIERVASEGATILIYEAVSAEEVYENSGREVLDPEELPYDVRRVKAGDELTVNGIDVEAIPAYNHPDGPNTTNGVPVHPKGIGCGFNMRIDSVSCFWPGDSDVLDEHASLEVSLFMPSIARSFTMNRHDAADLAETLRPDLVLPIHYNTFPALESDSRAFAGDVAKRGIPVVLDEIGLR